jgi:hypothetical protein
LIRVHDAVESIKRRRDAIYPKLPSCSAGRNHHAANQPRFSLRAGRPRGGSIGRGHPAKSLSKGVCGATPQLEQVECRRCGHVLPKYNRLARELSHVLSMPTRDSTPGPARDRANRRSQARRKPPDLNVQDSRRFDQEATAGLGLTARPDDVARGNQRCRGSDGRNGESEEHR